MHTMQNMHIMQNNTTETMPPFLVTKCTSLCLKRINTYTHT